MSQNVPPYVYQPRIIYKLKLAGLEIKWAVFLTGCKSWQMLNQNAEGTRGIYINFRTDL